MEKLAAMKLLRHSRPELHQAAGAQTRRSALTLITLLLFLCWPSGLPYPRFGLAGAGTLNAHPAAPLEEMPSPWGESVREELVRLQSQFGLTLVTVEGNAVEFVDFSGHSLRQLRRFPGAGWISRDGSEVATRTTTQLGTNWHLAILRPDGSGLREYPAVVAPTEFCWSFDGTKLAFRATIYAPTRHEPERMWIFDVNSGTTRDPGVVGHLTSQCWSPDGKQIVFTDANVSFVKNSSVRVLDLAGHTSRAVAKGINATWSPDGNWIAFYDQDTDTFYSIRPTGGDTKKLFKKWNATSGLLWSPDCRIVAFVSQAGLFEGQLPIIDVELYWLRARRLADGSETRLVGSFEQPAYQWLSSPEFIPK